ncbi:MAG: type II secretion system F family protein [Bdellovibrionales bacterium]|nr:type II secretion system F family protein [Bdellovibrionales bacterium]
MGSVLISVFSGVFFFLSLYLSFDYWYARVWLKMLAVRDQTKALQEELFIQKTPERVLAEHCITAGVFALLMFLIFLKHPIFAVISSAFTFYFAWRLPLVYLNKFVRPSRIKAFSVQMVDGLTLMANGMKSGLNVPQTLQIVVDEMKDPIRQEFNLVLSENKIGLSLEKAFENLGKRIPSEDVVMFVTSVNILRETGGNIAETFQTIVMTIRERMKLQSKISAMTAQGMTSAVIVGIMPWGLGAMLYFVDADTMAPLFTTIPGWLILIVITLLEAIGFFVIVKMVTIRV